MRRLGSGLVVALSPLTALADGPACAVPNCAPQPYCYAPPVMPESGPVQPEGSYVRGPESGEFAGPSESIGVKGFGIRLPEIRLDFPEIRLPHLVRYRRNPEMIVSESRAPYVRGEAMEFNQVAPESAPAVQPESGPMCVPPPPACSARERRLSEELARKEIELQEMNRRFADLEAAVSQLAERQQAQPVTEAGVRPSSYQSVMKTTTNARPLATSRSTAPPPSGPVKRTGSSVPETARFGLSTAPKTEEFGDWSGAAKR